MRLVTSDSLKTMPSSRTTLIPFHLFSEVKCGVISLHECEFVFITQ